MSRRKSAVVAHIRYGTSLYSTEHTPLHSRPYKNLEPMVSSQVERHAQHNTYTHELSRSPGGSTAATLGSIDGPRSIKRRENRVNYAL